jgi:hypothetical protein
MAPPSDFRDPGGDLVYGAALVCALALLVLLVILWGAGKSL